MSDTPETDAQIFDACDGQGCEAVLAGFARKLERERNSLQDQRDFCMGEMQRLRKERDEARDTISDVLRALGAMEHEGPRLAALRVKEERDQARRELTSRQLANIIAEIEG